MSLYGNIDLRRVCSHFEAAQTNSKWAFKAIKKINKNINLLKL